MHTLEHHKGWPLICVHALKSMHGSAQSHRVCSPSKLMPLSPHHKGSLLMIKLERQLHAKPRGRVAAALR